MWKFLKSVREWERFYYLPLSLMLQSCEADANTEAFKLQNSR